LHALVEGFGLFDGFAPGLVLPGAGVLEVRADLVLVLGDHDAGGVVGVAQDGVRLGGQVADELAVRIDLALELQVARHVVHGALQDLREGTEVALAELEFELDQVVAAVEHALELLALEGHAVRPQHGLVEVPLQHLLEWNFGRAGRTLLHLRTVAHEHQPQVRQIYRPTRHLYL